MANKEFQHIVRVGNTDLQGEKPLYLALQKIKGIGENFARATCAVAGISDLSVTGELDAKQVQAVEKIIEDPLTAGVPARFVNRQNDYETGENMHLLLADLDFTKEQDIKREKMIKSNRGLRHQWRLPVRGQRTQSNFRRNKGKGGAVKKRNTVRK